MDVFVRCGFPFNYDTSAAGDYSAVKNFGKGAQQQFKAECDINTIVKRFRLTGQVPVNVRAPQFGDFDGVVDFKTAMDAMASARDAFMEMPAEVRKRFDNDPQAFVEFCSDEKNRKEAEELGLVFTPEDASGSPEAAPEGAPKAPLQGEPSKPA